MNTRKLEEKKCEVDNIWCAENKLKNKASALGDSGSIENDFRWRFYQKT